MIKFINFVKFFNENNYLQYFSYFSHWNLWNWVGFQKYFWIIFNIFSISWTSWNNHRVPASFQTFFIHLFSNWSKCWMGEIEMGSLNDTLFLYLKCVGVEVWFGNKFWKVWIFFIDLIRWFFLNKFFNQNYQNLFYEYFKNLDYFELTFIF